MSEKIYEITDVSLSGTGVNRIRIDAKGNTRTSDWTNPALVPSQPTTPSDPDVFHFDFVADPPCDVSADVITPIETSHSLSGIAGRRITVFVHAETNEKSDEIELGEDRP
jgi:hypothetical protein